MANELGTEREPLSSVNMEGEVGQPTQQPRLSGHDKPYLSVPAKDAFIQVMAKGAAVNRPSLALSYVDPATDLEGAVQVASLYCNDELLRRMSAYRDAVLELSMGGGSEQDVEAARRYFALGCRLALGTNH